MKHVRNKLDTNSENVKIEKNEKNIMIISKYKKYEKETTSKRYENVR